MKNFNPAYLALAVFLLALGLYAPRLTSIREVLFDERYYVHAEELEISPWNIGHPPLGMAIIETGKQIFGDNPLGWRFFSLLAGCGGVALVYLVGLALGGLWVGIISAYLLLFDPLYYVMSRLGILDIFMTFFLLLFFWFYLKKYSWAAGLALGMALASKWPALFVLAGFLVLSLWEGIKTQEKISGLFFRIFTLVVLPLLVYLGIFSLIMPGVDWSSMLAFHERSFRCHYTEFPTQAEYARRWWSWIIFPQSAPILSSVGETRTEICFINNPALLWVGILGLLYLAREGWKKTIPGWWLPVWGFILLYFSWALFKRVQYLFYLLPAIPMLCLGSGFLLKRLGERKWGRIIVIIYLLFIAAGFVYLYPALNYMLWWKKVG